MPELRWLYLTALLSCRTASRGVAFAEALATVSHDRLTRLLQAKWSGHTRLEWAYRTRFVRQGGDLILDDPVMPTPFASALEGLAGVFSSQERRPGSGFSLVLLVWTDGRRRSPLGLRLWRRGGPSKDELALAWRRDARHRLCCRPASGRFDAWDPASRRLKRRRAEGGDVVGRRKKPRRFNGQALRRYRRHP